MEDLRIGDIICFNMRSLLDPILTASLSAFFPEWRRREFKPCHMRIAYRPIPNSNFYLTIDATQKGILPYAIRIDDPKCRNFHWLDKEPTVEELESVMEKYWKKPYDHLEYVKTIRFVLAHRSGLGQYVPPYDNDDRYHCWELPCSVMYDFGKPLKERNKPPLINEIVAQLEANV